MVKIQTIFYKEKFPLHAVNLDSGAKRVFLTDPLYKKNS